MLSFLHFQLLCLSLRPNIGRCRLLWPSWFYPLKETKSSKHQSPMRWFIEIEGRPSLFKNIHSKHLRQRCWKRQSVHGEMLFQNWILIFYAKTLLNINETVSWIVPESGTQFTCICVCFRCFCEIWTGNDALRTLTIRFSIWLESKSQFVGTRAEIHWSLVLTESGNTWHQPIWRKSCWREKKSVKPLLSKRKEISLSAPAVCPRMCNVKSWTRHHQRWTGSALL